MVVVIVIDESVEHYNSAFFQVAVNLLPTNINNTLRIVKRIHKKLIRLIEQLAAMTARFNFRIGLLGLIGSLYL